MEKNQDTALPRAKPNIFDAAHDSDAEAEGAQHTRSRRPGKNSRSDGTSTNTSNEVPKHRSHSPIYSSKYGISRPRELLSPHVHAYAHAHSYSIDTDPMQSSSESIGIVMAKKPRERHRHEQLAREDSPPTNATSVSGRPRNHFDTPECASSYASRISSFYQEEGSRPGTHGTVRSGHSYERDVYNGPASVSACLTMRQGGKSPDVSQTSTAKPLSGSGSGFGHHSDHDASFDESFYFQQVTGFTSTGAAPTGVGGGSLGEEFHDARTSSSSLYVPPSTGNRNHNRSRKAPDVQAAIDTAISSTESSGSGSLRHSRTRTPHLQTRMQTSNERYVEQQPQPRRNLIGAGKMIEGKMQNEQAAHEEQREIHRQGIRDAGAYVQRIPTELGDPDDTSTRWPESMFLGVRSEVSSESPSMVRGYMGRRPRAKYQGLGAVVEGNGEDEAARREAFKEMIVRDFHRRCITINREANRAKVAIDRDTDKSQMQKEREKQHIERVRIMRINRAKDESGYNDVDNGERTSQALGLLEVGVSRSSGMGHDTTLVISNQTQGEGSNANQHSPRSSSTSYSVAMWLITSSWKLVKFCLAIPTDPMLKTASLQRPRPRIQTPQMPVEVASNTEPQQSVGNQGHTQGTSFERTRPVANEPHRGEAPSELVTEWPTSSIIYETERHFPLSR